MNSPLFKRNRLVRRKHSSMRKQVCLYKRSRPCTYIQQSLLVAYKRSVIHIKKSGCCPVCWSVGQWSSSGDLQAILRNISATFSTINPCSDTKIIIIILKNDYQALWPNQQYFRHAQVKAHCGAYTQQGILDSGFWSLIKGKKLSIYLMHAYLWCDSPPAKKYPVKTQISLCLSLY